jgi:shikimate dehydrogenase
MSKKKAYVVGNNVSTSLSPAIFKYWFNQYHIDATYGYKEIKEDNFDKEIKSIFKEEGLCGLNITTPFKEKIIPHITKLDTTTKEIGSVNCVTKTRNFFTGTNTDTTGFVNALFSNRSQIDLQKRKTENLTKHPTTAIVVGFGGAAKAIIYSLKQMNIPNIKVFNRNFEKFKNKSSKTFSNKFQPHKLKDLEKYINTVEAKGQRLLVVNTVPFNVFNNFNNNKDVLLGTIGFDVVYRPREGTGFLNHFEPLNRIEGIRMLVYQAAPCFKLWFGIDPKIDQYLFNFLYKKMEENK